MSVNIIGNQRTADASKAILSGNGNLKGMSLPVVIEQKQLVLTVITEIGR